MNDKAEFYVGFYIGAVAAVVVWYTLSRLGGLDGRIRKLEWDKDAPKFKEQMSNAQARWREEAFKQHADMHRQTEAAK